MEGKGRFKKPDACHEVQEEKCDHHSSTIKHAKKNNHENQKEKKKNKIAKRKNTKKSKNKLKENTGNHENSSVNIKETASNKIDHNKAKSTNHNYNSNAKGENTSMSILYTNADQLTTSKKSELMETIERINPNIIAICEVKPKNGKERTELDYQIPNYTLFNANLSTASGRGVAVYVISTMNSRVSEVTTSIKFDEVCLLEVKLSNQDSLLFGCFYRSPTQSETSGENDQNLNLMLKELTARNFTHVCFVGDFNLKNINWETCSTPRNESSKESKFLETIKDCYLHQHVLEPTRARGNDEPSTIDLIFTNEIMQISNLDYNAPLGKSDHSMISFNFIYMLYRLSKATRTFCIPQSRLRTNAQLPCILELVRYLSER